MFEEAIEFHKKSENFMRQVEKEKQKEKEKKSREFHQQRNIATIRSIKETDAIKLSISAIAKDLLEELGFDRKASGTEYLADVIESLYHERKVFDENNEFFDFNNLRNNHYSFSNEYYECGLIHLVNCIQEELSKSYVNEQSLNDVIYDVTNDIISQYDRCRKKLVYNANQSVGFN